MLQRAAPPFEPAPETVAELTAMGFEPAAARRALARSHGDVAEAVNALTSQAPAAPFTADAVAAAVAA